MRRRDVVLAGVIAASGLAAGGGAMGAFHAEMRRARAHIASGSSLVQTSFGDVEYAAVGAGPPVIMIHGAGGGFDQGLAFTPRLVAAGWSVVAPSRFGYLRSSVPDYPSSENQADAVVEMMDALGIERAPVIGGSAGAPSAIALAIRHPDRCAALAAIVPAAYAPGRPPVPPPTPTGAWIFEHALRSDFLFWSGIAAAEDALIGSILATDPALVKAASPEERARVRSILRGILPVSMRARGLEIDARFASNPAPMPLDLIRAPTLALSLEDDRYQTAAAARHIAASVPGAELIVYPSGGHVWVGHDADVFRDIDKFLRRVAWPA
jgi:pimeloyl-ACP methyl ester carboxylesterase